MKVIRLDASAWRSEEDLYSALLPQLGAPAWHGHSLDALNDSIGGGDINAVEPPFRVEVDGADQLPEAMRDLLSGVARLFAEVRAETRKDVELQLR